MALVPSKRLGRFRTRGFTLLEIVVTLVLLSIVAAIVAPAFRTERMPDESLRSILAASRETAVRRAQTLVLHVDERGGWRIVTPGDTTAIGSGRFTDGTRDLRIRVNPLGACFNEGPSGAISLDAVACAITGTGSR